MRFLAKYMKKEFHAWLEKARSDISTAEYLFEGNKFEEAGFFCQQSVEKSLKALLIFRTGELLKSHDLPWLAQKAGIPQEMHDRCKDLTMMYVAFRYPDVPAIDDVEERAGEFIGFAKRIWTWVKRKISESKKS